MILNQAMAIENTTDVENRINSTLSDISDLSDRISNAQDSKESQDLANAIAAKKRTVKCADESVGDVCQTG